MSFGKKQPLGQPKPLVLATQASVFVNMQAPQVVPSPMELTSVGPISMERRFSNAAFFGSTTALPKRVEPSATYNAVMFTLTTIAIGLFVYIVLSWATNGNLDKPLRILGLL
jgi:hypothetical protein